MNRTHARIRVGAIAAVCCLAPSFAFVSPASAEMDFVDGFDAGDFGPNDGFGVSPFDDAPVPLEPSEWTFVVDSTVDAGDANHGDGICEADLDSDERCTLRAAVEEANATVERPLIWLPNLGGGYGLELGALLIERPMSIRGLEAPFITNLGTDRVFHIRSGSSAFTEISGLTVLDGVQHDGLGGNILIEDYSRVRLLDLIVLLGAARSGGGIGVTGGSTVIIEDTQIKWNRTEAIDAARGRFGGGVAITDFSDVVIRNSTIEENTATYGGGLLVSNASIVVYDSVINGNESMFFGGGVGVLEQAAARLVRTEVVENSSGHHSNPNRLTSRQRGGGGIYVHSIYVSIEDTTIADNTVVNPDSLHWSPDCHTVLTNATDYLLTLVGSNNVIGDLGSSCWTIQR